MNAANDSMVEMQEDDKKSDTPSVANMKTIESFMIELIPHKATIVPQHNPEVQEGVFMVQHTEAVYYIRRLIAEKAKIAIKEAKDLSTNHILGVTSVLQDKLDEYFMECVTKYLGWQLGEQF